jgi:hypothetical protein
VAEILGFRFEDGTQQFQRFVRSTEPPKDQRKVCAGRGEPGRDLDRAAQKRLRIAKTPDPRCQLGQHADGANVERIIFQVRFEQALGHVEPIVMKRFRRLDEPRMPMLKAGE